MRDVRAHYIRGNDSARIPSRFIILDTEADRSKDKKGEVQTWGLAVARYIVWRKDGTITSSTMRYETPKELWSDVSEFTRRGRRTVLYAHNLNYDLRISQALSILPVMSWTLRDIRLDGRGSWSKWSREKASLALCDSASIFPAKLAELATMFGMTKLPLPSCDQREMLFRRCEMDVSILSAAIIQYVTWLRTGSLGNWQMTGASQSWSHWRHQHYTHKILVHDNSEVLAAERAAMYSGRCEAFRWGNQTKGPYYEYDWQNSYPRIARDNELPTRYIGRVTAPNPNSFGRLLRKYAVLAELEITTTVPCVPSEYDGRVLWPTGTFISTLWDPEISLLGEHGATFRVRRAWLYQRQPALKGWAEWILSSLHDRSDTIEPWKKLILKHWSRALIGRFGMRYTTWEHFATAPVSRVAISDLYNSDNGSMTELMQVGTDIYIAGDVKEIDDGCPQITGYVMSAARAKLWRAYSAIGSEHVLYVDTDSLIVDSNGHQTIQKGREDTLFDGLRSKGRYRNVHIYGPRAIICDRSPTVAGMPKCATKTGKNEYTGEVWRGGKESVRVGEHDSVRIRIRPFTLKYNEHRRAFLADGTTLPYKLPGYTPDGITVTRPTRREEAIENGYPSMLAYSQTPQSIVRPEHYRNAN